MTVYCSAAGCHNCRRKDDQWKGTTFFRFPLNNKELNDQWVIQLGRKDFVPNVSSRLCSDHFEEECFAYQPFTNRRQLKPGSLPTKFNINPRGTKTGKCRRKKCRQYHLSRSNQFSGDSYARESGKEVLMAANNSSAAVADIASSSTSDAQEMNDSSDDGQGKMYIIRCNPQNGVIVKKIESDGTESVVPSCTESVQELSDQIPFESHSCRKRKACESCDEASERRHREKMQKWDRFLSLMEELVETCKSKNSDKPKLGEKKAVGNWPVIAEQLKQFVGLITIGKQNAYVKFELVD